ncbi:hypothetical protein AK88_05488 [Plasmodium fragile]|uniref:Uncharacterized protein n=1 Tax=Plasmodium fragile TaxID=5857 RepID=A0A0D9QDH1_PLAFR|nr:uncharacterized protein AK88_05488 [Plasmodium fragile]KJP84882.1 hypothetical protein AK88_05488 [Plasmodium fragile]
MSYATLGHLLAQYVLHRRLGADEPAYTKSLWQDIEDQLQKFMDHLKEDGMDAMYYANCKNTAWQHWTLPTARPRVVTSMGDRIICTLMTKALYFANGWSSATFDDMSDTGPNKDLKDFIRCGIVNMFMHLLEESACASPWGTFYAWYSVKQMKNDGPFARNLIYEETCKNGMEEDIEVEGWSMKERIKEWLRRHESIGNRIKKARVRTNCSRNIGELPTQGQGAKNTEDGDIVKAQVVQIAKNLSKGMAKIFREIKKEVKESGSKGKYAESPITDSAAEASDDDDADDDEEEDTNGKNIKASQCY